MSINVTVNGNPLSIRRGRMVLSDLDQIKKNERDRRRRLRLEQVRQQSREISDRLLERAKNIAKEELKKFTTNGAVNLKEIYDGKIMEVQQKYQEDMADIGQAHISATLEPDHDVIIQEKEKRNKLLASKRGKEAMKQVQNVQKDNAQQLHRERLREVRELEDLRSAIVAKLPQNVIPGKDAVIDEIDEGSKQHKSVKKKMRKQSTRKSPGKITKTYLKVPSDPKTFSPLLKTNSKTVCINTGNDSSIPRKRCVDSATAAPLMSEALTGEKSSEKIARVHEKDSKKAVSVSNVTSVEADQTPRYNPEDYVQQSSDSTATTNGDSSNLFSDDSSYFSDNGEQSKYIRKSKHVRCPGSSKVQLYDHSKHQRNTYEKPVDVVEKIHTWNEPSATDLAQEIRQTETNEAHLLENCKCNTQKRGEDAAMREKVRRDYQALLQNLNQLASEKRKLKASQSERYPKDVHVQEERRKLLRDQHQKKLNRALKSLINEECLEHPSCPVERPITITPRENNETDEVRVVWDASYPEEHAETSKSSQNQYRENEVSRDEQILNMLKKVERQRQLLLKEFGADLPNDIFNATAKPLFEKEKEKSIQMQSIPSRDTDVQTPLSPEIRVISTSYDERSKKSQIEKDNSSVEKVEIAVQTATGDKRDVGQDKSIQVELIQGKDNEFNSVTKDTETIPKHYPIEPKITVITPQADSSESTNCTGTNTVTNTDKQDLRTAKKKKRTVKKMKQISSKRSQRSSLQVNKAPSFTKKFPKSLSRSRYSKSQKIEGAVIDTPSKRIKIYVNKSGCSIKVNPPQTADVAVDASTQNSRAYSTDIQEQPATKLHYMQSRSKRTTIKDISDSSTSFASPPSIRPKNLLEVLSNNLSILEMLDSSANESMRRLRRDVSPVSTPETPSPRTMRIPSNVPHPSKISKMLKYASIDTQANGSSILSSTKSGYSASTDLSDYQQNEHVLVEGMATSSKEPLRSQGFCSCKNVECKLMHAKLDIMHNGALKNCPQILQKYQDLQTMCAERIVSLTNLIEKVRNEQKGMELSGFSAADETSLMQLPPSKPRTNDLQSVRQLVENIEAIHNQLAKTLIESQKIIKNEADVKEENQQTKETEVITLTNESTSKNVAQHIDSKTKVSSTKAKPRIICEERVNIQVDGLKIRHRPQLVPVTSDRDSGLSPKFYDEEMIEKLSKEILEQSKSFSNNVAATKETDNSVPNHTIEKLTDTADFKDEPSLGTETNNTAIKKQSNKEVKRTTDFVPLLADIPKISRTIENAMVLNGRSKPPVSLLSGPYRAEIESSGHELSTIIEFDTPDTLNKSQNVRAPTSIKKTAETQITRSTVTQNKNFDPSTSKISSIFTARKVQESLKISKDTESRNAKNKDEKKKYSVREPIDKRLHSTVISQRSTRVEESQPVSPTSTDRNKQDKSIRDRITSTSSNSFSGLSGISQIASTPTSDVSKYASSPEEMEMALKKLGLGWAITTVKRTREASALSSSSNSDDRTPMGTAKRIISPSRKQFDSNYGLPDFSDVSSISIKEASKSTEQAVLLKGRTSTPKMQYSNSNSARINSSNTNVSENYQEPGDALIVPDVSLNKNKS